MQNLQISRKQRGMSQAQLAELADVGHSYYVKIERGEAWPSSEVLEKLMNALKTQPLDLFKDQSVKSTFQSGAQLLMAYEMAPQRVRDDVDRA